MNKIDDFLQDLAEGIELSIVLHADGTTELFGDLIRRKAKEIDDRKTEHSSRTSKQDQKDI